MTAEARPPQDRRVQIGAVVSELQDEFPDITVSKVRFLEGAGLVTPARAASGYRYFSVSDIDRIRFILRAQRDRFWPLKVIREALDARDRGVPVRDVDGRSAAAEVGEDPHVPSSAAFVPAEGGVRMTTTELAAAAETTEELVEQLAAYSLIRADHQGYWGAAQARVVRSAARLAGHGLEPRHLRPFRLAADREVALVQQAARNARAGQERVQRQEDILRECVALHVSLVAAELGGDPT